MNQRLGCLLSVIFFLLSACRSLPVGKITIDDPLTPSTARAEASPSWSRIGIKQDPDRPCPEPRPDSGWEVSQLFRPGPQQPSIPPGLRSFCLYRGQAGADPDDLQGLTEQGREDRLVRLDVDYVGVAGIAAADPGGIKEQLEESFLVHAGEEGTDEHLAADPSPPVRLAILDTQRTGEGVPTTPSGEGVSGRPGCGSQHGYDLAQMARHLICRPSGECAARIVTELALPRGRFDPDSPTPCDGDGTLGTLGDLAAAVRRAAASREASGQDRLVINLSLGWNGALLGGLEGDYPSCTDVGSAERSATEASPLAVLCALKEAVCSGAVVVAAAGNRSGGPQSDLKPGPLLPAAWERLKAPSYAECTEILGHPPDSRFYHRYQPSRPLVHAVGGVRYKGHRLVNSRPGAEPRLVAYADHAIVKGRDGDFGDMSVYTGSSVAALVVSATAAAVWSSHPELDPEQLMNHLYESGYDLGRYAEFPDGGAPQTVRWISLCRALSAADGAVDCESGNPDSRRPPEISDIPSVFPEAKAIEASRFKWRLGIAECPAKKMYFEDRLPEIACPFYQFHDVTARPWAAPQPIDPPTASCSVSEGSCIIILEVVEGWNDRRLPLLRDATLEVGNKSYAIHQLESVRLEPGNQYAIRIPNCKVKDTTPASLTFSFFYERRTFSIEDPLVFLSIKDRDKGF